MNPFNDLSEENHNQIRKYLRFFRQKRDGILRTINREINDIKADKLNEDMYSREDMQEYTDFLASAIRGHVSGDLGSIINMGALALNQLLENSQDKGVELTLETSALENQVLLEAVEKMSLDAIPKNPRRGIGALMSFKDEAKAIKEEQARLEENNNRLQAEVNLLRHKLEMAERRADNISESKRQDDASDKAKLRRLEDALEEAKEENAKRINETSQFVQMRNIMKSQNVKIRELRLRLQKYEPDNVDEDEY